MDTISLSTSEGITRVTLARPEVRNAFNADVIRELTAVFSRLDGDPETRAVVLAGEGKSFCGGADIKWMREALDLGLEGNIADAQAMSDMFRAIDRCAKPVVGRIHGAALGGGAGLAAVCDIAIASDETIFGFTEVKLGIIPAVISPFVLAKIGESHARALFLTGERFGATRAAQIGLVHEVAPADALDRAVECVLAELRTAGPQAIAAAKGLIFAVSEAPHAQSRDLTATAIAKRRASDEGQEGLRAFLERRSPTFAK